MVHNSFYVEKELRKNEYNLNQSLFDLLENEIGLSVASSTGSIGTRHTDSCFVFGAGDTYLTVLSYIRQNPKTHVVLATASGSNSQDILTRLQKFYSSLDYTEPEFR